MITINLAEGTPRVEELIQLAQQGPVLLLTAEGQEFLLSEADDFGREVEMLRASTAFQHFLDLRSASEHRIPLEEVGAEIEQELAG